jgi:hypothetical protein
MNTLLPLYEHGRAMRFLGYGRALAYSRASTPLEEDAWLLGWDDDYAGLQALIQRSYGGALTCPPVEG